MCRILCRRRLARGGMSGAARLSLLQGSGRSGKRNRVSKMFKKVISAVAVAVTLAVPALVIAQQQGIALFTDNEPLTTTRLNQLVTTVNAIDFATPLFLEAVAGNADGA